MKNKGKEELYRCGGTMTEAQFLAWIRSALRSKSLRWPPRNEALVRARRAYKGSATRQKWEYQCAICKAWWSSKNVCADHYPKPAGSILSTEDIGAFANNLYCEIDNLRVLCKPCHEIHTLAESSGVSFEEAAKVKAVNEVMKLKLPKLLAYLKSHGFDGEDVSNKDKRRALVIKILNTQKRG